MTLERHVVVTGLMGVGKTTTARALAAALDVPMRDSDADIETVFGVTGRELVETLGVEELHRMEAAVLIGPLAAEEPCVIAAAGWVIEDPMSREAMRRRADVLVLELPIEALVERIKAGDHRRTMSVADLEQAWEVRGPRFEELATATLDASLPTEALVTHALAAL